MTHVWQSKNDFVQTFISIWCLSSESSISRSLFLSSAFFSSSWRFVISQNVFTWRKGGRKIKLMILLRNLLWNDWISLKWITPVVHNLFSLRKFQTKFYGPVNFQKSDSNYNVLMTKVCNTQNKELELELIRNFLLSFSYRYITCYAWFYWQSPVKTMHQLDIDFWKQYIAKPPNSTLLFARFYYVVKCGWTVL